MIKAIQDRGLWQVVSLALVLKIFTISIIYAFLEAPHNEWLGHVIGDMWYWVGFWQKTQGLWKDALGQKLIPYVDFDYGYPTLNGILYWFMGNFMDLSEGRWKSIMLNHGIFMAIADVVNAGLVYIILKEINPQRAFLLTGIFVMSLTGLVLSPFRYEAYVITFALVGYILHRQDKPLWAVVVWSLGCWLKWYPAIFILAAELRAFTVDKNRDRWWKSLIIFLGIAIVCNAPFMIGSIAKTGSLNNWLGTYTIHVNRGISMDTVLGVFKLWFGEMTLEGLANNITVFLITLAVVLRTNLKLEYKSVLIITAAIFCNRIYSPQFNLWFYPFLIFIIAQETKKRWLIFLGLYIAIDLVNITVFPFSFASAIIEMKGLAPGLGKSGGFTTVIFSLSILLRAALLAAIFFLTLTSNLSKEEKVKQLTLFES